MGFCFLFHDKSEWEVPIYLVISNKLRRQLSWYIDTVNIMFTL